MTQLQQEALSGITVTIHDRNFFAILYPDTEVKFYDDWVEGESFPIEHNVDIADCINSLVKYLKNTPSRCFNEGYPPYECKLTFHKEQE